MELTNIRILHITNGLGYGGVQKIIYQLCFVTKDEFAKVIVASSGGVYVDKLQEIGIEHFNISDITNKHLGNMCKIVRDIRKIVDDNNINIIHCHHRMAVLYAKLINRDVKIIYNNHTIYSDKRCFTNFVLKDVAIIADGEQAKRNVTDFFRLPESNVTVINNAVDEYDGYFEVLPEIAERRNKGDFIVLNSARLHPQKGMNYYIDAAKILIDKGYDISFYIVGDGPLKKEVQEQISRLDIGERMHMLGFRKDIKNVIKQCDILVLTSVYEGLPLTPMEAFSVSKAVIGTDIAGTREVIRNGYNGLLAVSKNAESIAQQIEKVYLNRSMIAKLEENAYQTFRDEFSITPFKQKYIDFYMKI